MTKDQANEIKRIIKKEIGDYTVYFDSKKGELRFTVAQWQDGCKCDPDELESKNILKILGALTSHDMRPKYHKAARRYQGFINCRYIVFE